MMTMGTFCSGTDAAVTVFETFLGSAQKVLQIEPPFPQLDHAFSVERDEAKRQFLADFFQMKHLYTDALQPVKEQVSVVSAGFPCDDASALHPNSSSDAHRLCVAQVRSQNGQNVLLST